MTLLYIDSMSEVGTKARSSWTSMGLSNNTGRDGSTNGAGGTNGSSTSRLTIPASAGIVLGYAFQCSTNRGILQLWGDTGSVSHLTLSLNGSNQFELRRGDGSGTLLATSTFVFPTNEWHYIEVKATVADSGGTCIVRVDGVEIINFTGDTKNGGTSTNIDSLTLVRGTGSAFYYVDDLYILNLVDATATQGSPFNNFLGDVRVERFRPNGNGASSQFTGSDGNSTDNYLQVDENPANTTDYNGRLATATGEKDLYALGDMSISVGTVMAVQPVAYMAKDDAGAASAKVDTRQSTGTVAASSAQVLTTTYTWYDGNLATKDPDNTAWTIAKVNSLQAGVEVA